ncbi:uncharacterized protein HD556DRAFT_1440534 [Suillus plorans]|uniref:Uncharacterized protein n=1 Tax=Suillus plorans TaxID=116603 RepID=A0A9P7IZX7_9AGAM|nr:uncharacterized protein HD556DRAFT_1440534 [Suillus plorans]KAG1798193.1 hypothetical protein HD556DRAFT_1440534 [Suillus plorans]
MTPSANGEREYHPYQHMSLCAHARTDIYPCMGADAHIDVDARIDADACIDADAHIDVDARINADACINTDVRIYAHADAFLLLCY